MIYHISRRNIETVVSAFNYIVIIGLLFLLLYNPQLKFMSSGFIRYIFLFLIFDLYGFGAIKWGVDCFTLNRANIDQRGPVYRCVSYGVRGVTFLLSYMFTSSLLSGLIAAILENVANLYLNLACGAVSILIFISLEYAGIAKLISIIILSFLRGIRITRSTFSFFTSVIFFYWLFLILFFFAISLAFSTYDFAIPSNMFKILIILFPVTFLTIKLLYKRGNDDFDKLLRVLSCTIALQSLFILMDWFIPSFSSFLLLMIQKSPIALRASGITTEAGDGLSLIQALGAITSFQLFMFSGYNKRNKVFAVLFTLQILSIAFVGRTGFVLVAVFILSSLVSSPHRLSNTYRLIKIFLLALMVCLSLYFFLIPPRIKSVMESQFLPWAFEFAYSFAEKGTLDTSSTDYIKDKMLFLPEREKTTLIGDGYFHDPANSELNYMGTDSGYVRLIFFAGFIGSSLFYIYFVLLLAMMYKISLDRSRTIFVSSVMVTLFVAQIKFPFLFVASTHIFLLLLFFCFLREHENRERENNCGIPLVVRTKGLSGQLA